MNDIRDIMNEALNAIELELETNWKPLTIDILSEMRLDKRAQCRRMYYSEQGIAVLGSTRALDYYGGFEYVAMDHTLKFGDLTVYSIENSRVRDHVCAALDKEAASRLRREFGERNEYEDDDE
jgi:hypothetical protein